jgi:aspartate/methionine/tyrosine aminotransferase
MRHLSTWVAGERREILDRRAAVQEGFPRLAQKGWRLLGCGAYFAYVTHPFPEDSETVAKRLVTEAGVLLLPGTMFSPDGDAQGARGLRIAFANVDRQGVGALFDRLESVTP